MRIVNQFNGYGPDGRRLYFKGGGSSNEAAKLEAERQARVQAAVDAINAIFDPKPYTTVDKNSVVTGGYDPTKTYYLADGTVFDPMSTRTEMKRVTHLGGGAKPFEGKYTTYEPVSVSYLDWNKINNAIASGSLYNGLTTVTPDSREKLYDEQDQAVYDLNAKEVNDQYADAERANRFALARNGLLGGSSDVESNANLQEKTNEGLVQAKALGQQAASDLRTADEQSKQSLIAMAQSGIDTGTAQQMAQAQLNANAQSALGQRGGATIGNLFDNLSQAYLTRKIMQAANNGYNLYGNNYNNLSTSKSYGGTNT